MRVWTSPSLNQIMACRLLGGKPLSEQIQAYCQLEPYEKTWLKFDQNSYIFIHENAFANVVWEMAAILSRPQCVNPFGAQTGLLLPRSLASPAHQQSLYWLCEQPWNFGMVSVISFHTSLYMGLLIHVMVDVVPHQSLGPRKDFNSLTIQLLVIVCDENGVR